MLPNSLSDHISSLVPGIEKALNVRKNRLLAYGIFDGRALTRWTILFSFVQLSVFIEYMFSQTQDKSSNSNLKIEALVFLRLVLASHSPTVFHPHIKVSSCKRSTGI